MQWKLKTEVKFNSPGFFVCHFYPQDMQPSFQSELQKNLETFKTDKIEYVTEYRETGPMQPGLTPREASDKLILFQVKLKKKIHFSSKIEFSICFFFIVH